MVLSARQELTLNPLPIAHDVAEDMVEAGLSSVTMVQRSPTRKFVISLLYTSLELTNNLLFVAVFPIEWYKEVMDCKDISEE